MTITLEAAVRDGSDLVRWDEPNTIALEDERIGALFPGVLAGPTPEGCELGGAAAPVRESRPRRHPSAGRTPGCTDAHHLRPVRQSCPPRDSSAPDPVRGCGRRSPLLRLLPWRPPGRLRLRTGLGLTRARAQVDTQRGLVGGGSTDHPPVHRSPQERRQPVPARSARRDDRLSQPRRSGTGSPAEGGNQHPNVGR